MKIMKTVYDNVTVDRVVSIYDGDTIKANIYTWPRIVGENIGIRIRGIDTPEIRDKRPLIKALAFEARDYLINLIENAKTIELRNIQRGKYFRLVADVYVDNKNISDILIDEGLAVSYDGGKKPTWEINS